MRKPSKSATTTKPTPPVPRVNPLEDIVVTTRVRLAVVEALDNRAVSRAAAARILRSLADEIDPPPPAAEPPPRRRAGPEVPAAAALPSVPVASAPRLSMSGLPDLRLASSSERAAMVRSSPFAHLFRQPSPLKCAVLRYLSGMTEPVPLQSIVRALEIEGATPYLPSLSQALRALRVAGHVLRPGKHGSYAWSIAPSLRASA